MNQARLRSETEKIPRCYYWCGTAAYLCLIAFSVSMACWRT